MESTTKNINRMSEEKVILRHCENALGIDLVEKNRTRQHVYGRFIFYQVCKELINNITLQRVGDAVDRDHATVMHGLKAYQKNIAYKDFQKMDATCRAGLKAACFYGESEENKDNKDVVYLLSNKAELEQTLRVTEQRLEDALNLSEKRLSMDSRSKEIQTLLDTLPDDKIDLFISTRLQPFITMNA